MEFKLVYITVKDKDEALRIGRALIQARLAACINMINGMESIYRWEDDICVNSEVLLLAKTTSFHTKKLISKVKSLHSYEVPCITVIPILDGYPPFLEWIKNEATG